jgi:raffinose synthase
MESLGTASFFDAPGCKVEQLDASIWQASSPPNVLIAAAAVRLFGALQGPGVAIFRRTDFWTAPEFWDNQDGIPDRTLLLLWKEEDEFCAVLPLLGQHARVELAARGGAVFALAETRQATTFEQSIPLAIGGRAASPWKLIERLFDHASRLIGTCRRSDQKTRPEWTERLGWCSWNAFGTAVSEADVLATVAAFEKAPIKPGFLILDDGWQSADAQARLVSTSANGKFPRGLAPLIHECKRRLGLRHFGVWHAWQGYWKGVSPEGAIAKKHRVLESGLLHPVEWQAFYDAFYAELTAAGVDFTKADNQGWSAALLPEIYAHVSGMRILREAVEGASARWHQSGLLNCMSEESTILYQLQHSNVIRNSDDYYPDRPANPTEHVLQNAWNAIWTRTLAIPDWDMFQTHHPAALWHAAARALSGGPIYITDEPGRTDYALLQRLVFPDGRVPYLNGFAVPLRANLLQDPRKGGLLGIWNRSGHAGVIGLFNMSGGPATAAIGPRDAEFEGEGQPMGYAVYSSQRGFLAALGLEDRISIALDPNAVDILTIAPIREGLAVFGAVERLNPPGWLGACRQELRGTELLWQGELRATSSVLFATTRTASRATLNGRDVPITQDAHCVRVELPLSAQTGLLALYCR